jgi:hypothetical protein
MMLAIRTGEKIWVASTAVVSARAKAPESACRPGCSPSHGRNLQETMEMGQRGDEDFRHGGAARCESARRLVVYPRRAAMSGAMRRAICSPSPRTPPTRKRRDDESALSDRSQQRWKDSANTGA